MADRNVIAWKGDVTQNYIKQINDGTTSHDLALTKGITFYEGKSATDEQGITWDGTRAIEIVIPSVTDIIQDPVRMVGTVGTNAAITPNTYNPNEATKGDLLYITENCTFKDIVCEAGDMAVYDGTAWRVIQGENQVSIIGVADSSTNNVDYALGETPAHVLDVEGKHLRLGIDYADVLAKTAVYKNSAVTLSLSNGIVNVAPMYVTLSQGTGATLDISKAESIDLPTSLADGTVTISDKVLQAADFSFVSGAYPTATLNSTSITVNATHGMGVGVSTDGNDFVTAVTAIKGVSFIAGSSSGNNDLTYVAGLSAISGTSFVNGIHTYTDADQGKNADLVIPGAVSVSASDNTFAYAFGEEAASGEVLSSITVGAVTIGTGTDVLTGLSGEGNSVVTDVTFGTAVSTADLGWFVNGLGTANTTSGDVVTNVAVGAVTLVDAASGAGTSAMVSASVSNHVLSFSTAKFQTPVTVSQAATTVTYNTFTKAGVSLDGFSFTSDTFTKGGISQANTTVSYRSLLSKAVTLNTGSETQYFFDKAEDHNYEAVLGYSNISTTAADVTKKGAYITDPNITATIPADSVVVDITAGTLPTFTVNTATGTISGEVGTTLTSSPYTWSGIDVSKMAGTTVPGGYTLVTANASGDGIVEVAAAASDYAVTNGQVTIAANSFVTDVLVDGSTASQTTPPVNPGE